MNDDGEMIDDGETEDDVAFHIREGTRPFWCTAYDGEQAIAGTCIMTISAEDAVQSMAQNVIEGSNGEWTAGKIEVRDQSEEDTVVRTFAVTCELTDLGGGEVEADVIIEES